MSDFQSPNFKNPPVIEVVLGLQFEPLDSFKTTHVGKLHEIYEADYPTVSEHSLLEPKFENFATETFAPSRMVLKLVDNKAIPRVWFVSEDENSLLQLQRDRFIYNWRRKEPSEEIPYPRYENIRDEFKLRYKQFLEFLTNQKLPEPAVNQIEVTYVNLISCEDNDFSKSMHEVFEFWNPDPQPSPLGEPETQKFVTTYLIKDDDERIGRLSITSHTLIRHDNKKYLRVDIVARGKPKDVSLNGILDFMNLGRSKIVLGFDSLTTEDMHKIWGKE
ncbi:MAG: TIGR04255 family protein [Deltaproteobacteria bacterium]|nr:TIGR04255 family protein [Deltaproteobacteria bacterium]